MDASEIFGLVDDLDIDTATPAEYATAQAAPSTPRVSFKEPLPDGRYTGKLLSAEFDRDANGELRTPRTPVLVLSIEITEGPFTGKQLRYQRVYSKTFNRRGVTSSGLGDLLTAINAHDIPADNKQKFMAVKAAVDAQAVVKFKTVTRAYDKRYFEDKGGQHLVKGTEEYKQLNKAAEVRGFDKFKKTDDYRLITQGPSGEIIEGRTEINTWLPSTAD